MTGRREQLGTLAAAVLLLPFAAPRLRAQSPASSPAASAPVSTPAAPAPSAPVRPPPGDVLDRILAVVNDDIVLESDVDEELRFAAFQPLGGPGEEMTRPRAVERLINRDLILQQLRIQPQAPVTEKDLDTQLLLLRKELPVCKARHCENDAEWAKFIAEQGFTEGELRERWKRRMEVLRFIEQRFRMGIIVKPEEIRSFYEKTLLPQYAQQNVKPPKLEVISDRIQEILLQGQVSSLLGDWLKSLRAQGTVRIVGTDEAAAR